MAILGPRARVCQLLLEWKGINQQTLTNFGPILIKGATGSDRAPLIREQQTHVAERLALIVLLMIAAASIVRRN